MVFQNFCKKHWPLLILIIFFGWLFFNLLSSHMLEPKSDGLYSGGSTWGDLAFHLSLISSIKERGFSALKAHPVYIGEKLRYPFVSDFISATLEKIGVSLRWSLILPSFIFLMVLVVLLYFLVFKITHSRIGAVLVPFLFFFNGSTFSLKYFWQDFKASGVSLITFFGQLTKEYGHLADYRINFSNIIADYILPQRAIILGLVLGVAVVYFLWLYWQSGERKKLLYAGLLTAIIPIIHTHTFMSLVFAACFLVLIEFFQNIKNFKKIIINWLWFALPVLILALPQVLWLYPASSQHFMRFGFGWMSGSLNQMDQGENVLWFWIKNLGLYLPAFIIGFVLARPKLKTFYLAFLGLFVLSNLIIFQPHIYDNMKIMLWWFLLSLILIGDWFAQIKNKMKKEGYLVIAAIFLLLIPTGFLSVFRESYVNWRIFSQEDMALANFVLKNTPKEAIFLTSDRHNHPIPCFTGRRILMGYRGWLWTHGIDYRQRENDVISIYEGAEKSFDLIKQYGINYIVIEQDKIKDFHINKDFFILNQEQFMLIYQSPNYLVFQVKT